MKQVVLCTATAVLLAIACSSGEEQILPTDDAVGTADQSATDDLSRPPEDEIDTPPPAFPEDFVVSFVYRGIVPDENTEKSDLYIVDSKGRNPLAPSVKSPVALTTFAIDPDACQLVLEKTMDGEPLSTAPCSCNLGCVVDRSLTWIAVTVEKPSATGFAFQVGKFNANHEVQMVKGAIFKDIVDLAFAGGYLYFSQTKYCTGTNCQFLVYRYDLENIPQPESLFLLPPDDDPDLVNGSSTTTGHFVASDSGDTLAFLSPTIRSNRLYVWRNDTLEELDYLCPGGMQGGHCTGSGTHFSDVEPLALSPNGKKLTWFVTTPDGLTAQLYDTDAATRKPLALMDTTGKDFGPASCAQIQNSDWKFNTVQAPRFAPDGKSVLFVASSHCDLTKRPYTDVVRLPLAAFDAGGFDHTSFTNITRNMRQDVVENTIIEAFDLSPEGGNIAYTASPVRDADGKPLSPNSANANKSREVWVAATDGSQKTQVTYNAKYSATWLLTLPGFGE